ncbi:MAG: spermidine synthase [Marinobacterium sp.]|nr:spermidine synthase [Marinobacterium sp.]
MALPGKEIYRANDEFGAIYVFEDGLRRYLAFGGNDEQSCWLKTEPLVPQHEYSRAMLLVLLFSEPRQSLCLGLGAGVLNSCLHVHFPQLKQQVVELRPAVVEAAYRMFQLPCSKRLVLHTMDANEYLLAETGRKVDVIFSDIYGAEGLDEQQLSDEYLENCYRRLKSNGWLVLNCWREHQGSDALERLQARFADIRGCTTQSGNWLLFAGKQRDSQSSKQLRQKARVLGQKMDINLLGLLSRLTCY